MFRRKQDPTFEIFFRKFIQNVSKIWQEYSQNFSRVFRIYDFPENQNQAAKINLKNLKKVISKKHKELKMLMLQKYRKKFDRVPEIGTTLSNSYNSRTKNRTTLNNTSKKGKKYAILRDINFIWKLH